MKEFFRKIFTFLPSFKEKRLVNEVGGGPDAGATPDTSVGGCNVSGEYYYSHVGIVDVADYILATEMELITGDCQSRPTKLTTISFNGWVANSLPR